MSSATQIDPKAARAAVEEASEQLMDPQQIAAQRLKKLSKRQKLLDRLWRYFRVEEYDNRKFDWNGLPRPDRDALARGDMVPNGFEDLGDSLAPLSARRPVAPLGLVRSIVSRFTGLLFSTGRGPIIGVPGDKNTEEYLTALLKQGRFWTIMARTRNYGGAMGSACVGFKFVDGELVFEVFDPRWCTPKFMDSDHRELKSLIVSYCYPKEKWDTENDMWKEQLHWYRREITAEKDAVWVDIKDEGEEPDWDEVEPTSLMDHGLGFVPCEWIQNLPKDDTIDGDPDCQGCYDIVEAIDALIAQAHYGVLANCDPTLVISSPDEIGSIKKGSDNAIKLTTGSANYMEINGQGPRTAQDMAKLLEERVYRLAQCVPENVMFGGPSSGEKTATEIERSYSSMLEKADLLRDQYGPAIIRLCEKLIRAVRQLTKVVRMPDGELVRGSIKLPPKTVTVPEGFQVQQPLNLGAGRHCFIRWGNYFKPTLTDIETAIRAFTMARDANALDDETMVKLLAPFYGVDQNELITAIQTKLAKEQQAQEEADAAAAEEAANAEEPAEESAKPAQMNVQAYITGLVTANEYRESLGLGPIPDGDKTFPQYKAANADMFTASAAADSKQAIDVLFTDAKKSYEEANPGEKVESAEDGDAEAIENEDKKPKAKGKEKADVNKTNA